MMKMEENRAQTTKKIPKKAKKVDYQTVQATESKPASFADVEITQKDKQRSSEVGIAQKHRRL